MEGLKEFRTILRKKCTMAVNKLETQIEKRPPVKECVVFKMKQLENKTKRLYEMDDKIRQALLEKEAQDYREHIIEVQSRCEIWLNRSPVAETIRTSEFEAERKLRLSKLELQRLDGNVKNWVVF